MNKFWIIGCSIIYLLVCAAQALPAEGTGQAAPAAEGAVQAAPAESTGHAAPAEGAVQAAPAEGKGQALPASSTGPFCSNGKWGCGDDWKISLSVPAIQLRLNEQAKIFSGLDAGIQLNNLFSRQDGSLLNALIITPGVMLSTTTVPGSTNGTTRSDYVFSGAVLFGFKKGNKSLQVGYAYDLINTEGAGAFRHRYRDSLLLNVGVTAF